MSPIGFVVFTLGALAGGVIMWFYYRIKKIIQNFKENL